MGSFHQTSVRYNPGQCKAHPLLIPQLNQILRSNISSLFSKIQVVLFKRQIEFRKRRKSDVAAIFRKLCKLQNIINYLIQELLRVQSNGKKKTINNVTNFPTMISSVTTNKRANYSLHVERSTSMWISRQPRITDFALFYTVQLLFVFDFSTTPYNLLQYQLACYQPVVDGLN